MPRRRFMGRLKPGVTLDQANAEFIALARQLAQDISQDEPRISLGDRAAAPEFAHRRQFRQTVWAMLAAVILVLLIACVNVMNMQFGRAALRAKELAIRGALGATRWRLVRQMLTESLVVAVSRSSRWSSCCLLERRLLTRAMNGLPLFALPYWIQFTIDAPVFAFTVGDHFARDDRFRSHPGTVSAHSNAAEMMKEGGRGNSSRLVNVITRASGVAQIALTAALLIAATLEIRSIRNQLTARLRLRRERDLQRAHGFDGRRLSTKMDGANFSSVPLRELRANPQFDSAALSDRFRMTFAGGGQYEVDGQNYLTDRDRPRGNFESVSDNYFATLGLKILEGRDFTIDDADTSNRSAIVNASFARKHWGNQSALGHQVRIFNPGEPQPWRTIVGVVPDTLMQGPFDQQTDSAGFYMPLLGASPATQFCTIIVRPRAGQRAETLGPALSKSGCSA